MNHRQTKRRPTTVASDGGFTLIELLVSMTLAIVVLLAILGASDVFRTTSNAATNLSVAQDNERTVLRDMTDTLRQAVQAGGTRTPVVAVTGRNDMTVAAYVRAPAGTLQPGWVRYCTTADGHSLLRGVRIGGPGTDAGPCTPRADTDPTAGWVYGTVVHGTFRHADRLFSFSSADCFGACTLTPSAIRTIGIRLEITTDTSGTRTTVLRGAVSLRNRSDPAPIS